MNRGWRAGYGLGRDWVWFAPVVSLSLVALAQATNADGDLRAGMFPWLMAAAAVGLALLGPRLIAVHGPDVSRSVLIGGWWIALAFLGIAGFFVAVAVGALLGIDEDDAGVFALLPMLSMAFGLLSMTPAAAMAAVGTARAGVIAWWGVAALWTVTPLLVMLLVYGGFAEGTAEKVGASLFLAVFAISWVVVGASLKSANVASTADAA